MGAARTSKAPAWLQAKAWDQPVLRQVRDFLVSILAPHEPRRGSSTRKPRKPSGSRSRRPRDASEPREPLALSQERLECDLYLTMGTRSLPLFLAGQVNTLAFYQRFDVSLEHEVEYVTRLEAGEEGEGYLPFGLFRLRTSSAIPLPRLKDLPPVWERLYREHGLTRLPKAREMLGLGRARRIQHRESAEGFTVVTPDQPQRAFKRTRVGSYDHGDVMRVIRDTLSPRQRIAWVEQAFPDAPPLGEIVHRYYLDERRRAYLLRHHWAEGKLLFRAETSSQALRLCEASGACQRPRREAA